MAVVAFIEPPQRDVIEEILRHCGLWHSSEARTPPAGSQGDGLASAKDPNSETHDLTFVDLDTFLANFQRPLRTGPVSESAPMTVRGEIGWRISGRSWVIRATVDRRWTSPRLTRANTLPKSLPCCFPVYS